MPSFLNLVIITAVALSGCAKKTDIDDFVDDGQCRGASPDITHPMPQAALEGFRWRLPSEVELTLRIHVASGKEGGIEKFVASLYDPKHPNFHKFLSPSEYDKKFGPSDKQMADVKKHLESHGFYVSPYPMGSTWHATGLTRHAESAFNTTLHGYRLKDGMHRHTISEQPRLPRGLPDVVVEGLSSKPDKITHIARPTGAAPHFGSSTIDAATVRSAYNIPASATGKGQTLAMLELDGYVDADLDAYAQANNIRRVPTKNICIGSYDCSVYDQGARVEVTMDIQLANAMAPNLDKIVVYEAANGAHGLTDIFNRLANPQDGEELIRVASLSWGTAESQLSADDVKAEYILLRRLAAQGQTVFVASGDDGATDDGSHLGTDDPASQPYAVAVGGSTLHVNRDGTWSSEKTWSGSGGGISCFWKAPAWQKGIEHVDAKASLTMRDVPDVCLNANPATGYKVYIDGWQTVGGTSCAAPLWASFTTLVNEARAAADKKPMGFMAPAIYQAAQSLNGRAAFHDIVAGNNGYYPAILGVDDATGWGSMIGANLINILAAQ